MALQISPINLLPPSAKQLTTYHHILQLHTFTPIRQTLSPSAIFLFFICLTSLNSFFPRQHHHSPTGCIPHPNPQAVSCSSPLPTFSLFDLARRYRLEHQLSQSLHLYSNIFTTRSYPNTYFLLHSLVSLNLLLGLLSPNRFGC